MRHQKFIVGGALGTGIAGAGVGMANSISNLPESFYKFKYNQADEWTEENNMNLGTSTKRPKAHKILDYHQKGLDWDYNQLRN